MKLKHRINISVTHPDGKKRMALKGGDCIIRERFLKWLLGEKLNVLVITPGDSVCSVGIHECYQRDLEDKQSNGDWQNT
jgi:hypothetical protein